MWCGWAKARCSYLARKDFVARQKCRGTLKKCQRRAKKPNGANQTVPWKEARKYVHKIQKFISGSKSVGVVDFVCPAESACTGCDQSSASGYVPIALGSRACVDCG